MDKDITFFIKKFRYLGQISDILIFQSNLDIKVYGYPSFIYQLDINSSEYQKFKNSPTNYVGCHFFWGERSPKGNNILFLKGHDNNDY